MKLDETLRIRRHKNSRFVATFLGIVAVAGLGLTASAVAEAARGHNLVVTGVPARAKFRDPETVVDRRVLRVRAVNVLTGNGHSRCFKAQAGKDINTGWQVTSGVRVQAYLHAAADCGDGTSFDSPFTTVVPNNVKTRDYRFKLR